MMISPKVKSRRIFPFHWRHWFGFLNVIIIIKTPFFTSSSLYSVPFTHFSLFFWSLLSHFLSSSTNMHSSGLPIPSFPFFFLLLLLPVLATIHSIITASFFSFLFFFWMILQGMRTMEFMFVTDVVGRFQSHIQVPDTGVHIRRSVELFKVTSWSTLTNLLSPTTTTILTKITKLRVSAFRYSSVAVTLLSLFIFIYILVCFSNLGILTYFQIFSILFFFFFLGNCFWNTAVS